MANETQHASIQQWRDIVYFHYPVSESYLRDILPSGVMLAAYQGQHYLTLASWVCREPEYNQHSMRLYTELRTIATIVTPKGPQLTYVVIDSLDSERMKMTHESRLQSSKEGFVTYTINGGAFEAKVSAQFVGQNVDLTESSLHSFLTEHFWIQDGTDSACPAYYLNRESWNIWPTISYELEHVDKLFDPYFAQVLSSAPRVGHVSPGSSVLPEPCVRDHMTVLSKHLN